MGGLSKQETRDCKGIKILLGICPFSHRCEDLLPLLEVFWNLRLSHVSFLLSLFFPVPVSSTLGFLSLPLCWVFFLFSFRHGSFFHRVGLLLCMVSSSWGREEVVSARLNLTNCTIDVRGVCNFPRSILSQQKFEATYGPALQPLVRPVLQLRVTAPCYSSILFRK